MIGQCGNEASDCGVWLRLPWSSGPQCSSATVVPQSAHRSRSVLGRRQAVHLHRERESDSALPTGRTRSISHDVDCRGRREAGEEPRRSRSGDPTRRTERSTPAATYRLDVHRVLEGGLAPANGTNADKHMETRVAAGDTPSHELLAGAKDGLGSQGLRRLAPSPRSPVERPSPRGRALRSARGSRSTSAGGPDRARAARSAASSPAVQTRRACGTRSRALGYGVSARTRRPQLRGEESEEDARFCRERLGAEVVVLDGAASAKRRCVSSATPVARDRLRATGHTASDQVETILYRLVSRGTATGIGVEARRRRRAAAARGVARRDRRVLRDEGLRVSRRLEQADTRRGLIRDEVLPLLRRLHPGRRREHPPRARRARDAAACARRVARLAGRLEARRSRRRRGRGCAVRPALARARARRARGRDALGRVADPLLARRP